MNRLVAGNYFNLQMYLINCVKTQHLAVDKQTGPQNDLVEILMKVQ